MKKIVKGKYSNGKVTISENIEIVLENNSEIYIMIDEEGKEDILDETFGIWIDEEDYLEKLRKESEKRIDELGVC
jgi:tRNA uridine 5-carbamoylmethylation protein Kti12